MKIENMTNNRGNKVPNQFIIYADDGTYFQSYSSIIVKRHQGKTYLDREKWDYSVTTGKYRNMFLSETKKETEKKISEGIYTLADLN